MEVKTQKVDIKKNNSIKFPLNNADEIESWNLYACCNKITFPRVVIKITFQFKFM